MEENFANIFSQRKFREKFLHGFFLKVRVATTIRLQTRRSSTFGISNFRLGLGFHIDSSMPYSGRRNYCSVLIKPTTSKRFKLAFDNTRSAPRSGIHHNRICLTNSHSSYALLALKSLTNSHSDFAPPAQGSPSLD
jgi:hypothetical protein